MFLVKEASTSSPSGADDGAEKGVDKIFESNNYFHMDNGDKPWFQIELLQELVIAGVILWECENCGKSLASENRLYII